MLKDPGNSKLAQTKSVNSDADKTCIRLNHFTKKTPVLGRLLVFLVAFALGAVAGIVVDRPDLVTALKNRLDPRMAALESRAGMRLRSGNRGRIA